MNLCPVMQRLQAEEDERCGHDPRLGTGREHRSYAHDHEHQHEPERPPHGAVTHEVTQDVKNVNQDQRVEYRSPDQRSHLLMECGIAAFSDFDADPF